MIRAKRVGGPQKPCDEKKKREMAVVLVWPKGYDTQMETRGKKRETEIRKRGIKVREQSKSQEEEYTHFKYAATRSATNCHFDGEIAA